MKNSIGQITTKNNINVFQDIKQIGSLKIKTGVGPINLKLNNKVIKELGFDLSNYSISSNRYIQFIIL